MANLKIDKSEWTCLSEAEAQAFGTNILSVVTPKVTPLSDEPIVVKIGKLNQFGEHLLNVLTDDNQIDTHLDIFGAPFCLTYDLGQVDVMEKICISGHGEKGGNYAINDYEIYVSNSEEDLYREENLVVKYYRSPDEPYMIDDIPYEDNVYDVSGEGRYFGVKFLSSCPQDEITRIGRIGVFSKFNDVRMSIREQLSAFDCIDTLKPEIHGEYKGRPEDITNGIALMDGQTVEAVDDIEVEFVSDATIYANELYIIARNSEVSHISANGENIPFEHSSEDTFSDRKIHKFTFSPIAVNNFKVGIKKGSIVDMIFTNTPKRAAKIDFSTIINSDYMGAGCNAIPTSLSDYGIEKGFNEVYWELEKHHIQKSKPHCARVWFQVDWVVQTLEQYESGDWQFDNSVVDSVIKYCEVFNENGIEVEFNFGWKVGRAIHDWFPVGGIPDTHKDWAAPKDPYNYAKACVATLEYLILEKGLDNIKYLSFYNEISLGSGEKHYDFAINGEPTAYWASMARYTKYFLDRSKVAGMVEIWAFEQTSNHAPLMDRANILMPDVFTRHSVHVYGKNYEDMCDWCDELVAHSDGKPIVVTEIGNSSRTKISWKQNHVNNLLGAANHGVSGAFIWVLAGSPLLDPLNWINSRKHCDDIFSHWAFLPIADTLEDAGESFYELSLLYHYIPKHAISVRSNPEYSYEDVRFNAFMKDGEYTLFAECRGDVETEIKIDLGRAVNRTFYRHTYRHTSAGEGNFTVPPTDKVLEVKDKIEDTLSDGYQLVVYTTVKPIRQVIMDKVDIRVSAGSKVKIGATVLDDDLGQSVSYSISKSLIEGAKLENGEVIIPETAKPGDMLSVKAELKTGEYGISIIRVI